MKLVDSHSHLFLEEFSEDLPQVMERARQAGVTHIFMPNVDRSTLPSLLSVCAEYEGYCFPMLGLHPTSVASDYRKELGLIKTYLEKGPKFVAIGEIGLDLYWDKTYLNEQVAALEEQLRWALDYGLPVVIHCREAFDCLYNILCKYKGTTLRGILHSFTGTVDDARRMMEFPGFLIGINGVVTFKKSLLPEVLADVPLEKLVLETDAPYLAPVPQRGKRNESAYIVHTLQKVADIYGVLPEEVAQVTSENALNLFGMVG